MENYLLIWMVIRVNRVCSLNHREDNAKNNGPRGPRTPPGTQVVGMGELRTICNPSLRAVRIDIVKHRNHAAIWIKHYALSERVEELDNGVIASNGVQDDTMRLQEDNVFNTIYDYVHEVDIGSHLIPCPYV